MADRTTEEVLREVLGEFLRDATPNLDSIEEVCAEFQRDTGFLAPGKDEAASVNSGVTTEQRRAAWNEWARKKMDERNARARSALALPSDTTTLRAEVERLTAEVRGWQDATRAVYLAARAAQATVAERDRELAEAREALDAARDGAFENIISAEMGKMAASFAVYHEEHARYGGVSREFHERAAGFLRAIEQSPPHHPAPPAVPPTGDKT